jgi:hypothetical protein
MRAAEIPPPPVFWLKSAETTENKRVDFFVAQKSAEESEKKELE